MNDKSQSERLFKVVDLITAADAHNKQNVIMCWYGCQWCLSVFFGCLHSTFYWSPFVKFLGALKWKHVAPPKSSRLPVYSPTFDLSMVLKSSPSLYEDPIFTCLLRKYVIQVSSNPKRQVPSN